MSSNIIYTISDSASSALVTLAEEAASRLNIAYEIIAFSDIREISELEALLSRIVEQGNSPLIFFSFSSEVLNDSLTRFCDRHHLQYLDIMTYIVYALQLRSGEDDVIEASRHLQSSIIRRIYALDFASRYDDGKDPRGILQADICLIGISRTTKTPLSMYLANRNYRVANIPLVPETTPPKELFEVSPHKIFGLTSNLESLTHLRSGRLESLGLPPEAEYASTERVLEELAYSKEVMKRIGCPIVDVSARAVEETAEIIIKHLNSAS